MQFITWFLWLHVLPQSAPILWFHCKMHLRDRRCSPAVCAHVWWSLRPASLPLWHTLPAGSSLDPWCVGKGCWTCSLLWRRLQNLWSCILWCEHLASASHALHTRTRQNQPRSWRGANRAEGKMKQVTAVIEININHKFESTLGPESFFMVSISVQCQWPNILQFHKVSKIVRYLILEAYYHDIAITVLLPIWENEIEFAHFIWMLEWRMCSNE